MSIMLQKKKCVQRKILIKLKNLKLNPQRQKADQWLPGAGGWGQGVTANWDGVSFPGDGNVLVLDRSGGCTAL